MSSCKGNIFLQLSSIDITPAIPSLVIKDDEEVQKTVNKEQEKNKKNINEFIFNTTDNTLFKRMLDQGLISDVDVDNGSWTALEYQIMHGSITGIECLLKLGANPNKKKDIHESTPLHYAAYTLHRWHRSYRPMDILKLLLDYGADKTITNKYGKTALDIIQDDRNKKRIFIHDAHIKMFQTYTQKFKEQDSYNNIKMFVNGNLDLMREMFKCKAISNVNLKDESTNDMTALMYQVKNGIIKGMEFLLEKGADPNLQDKFGNSALHYALKFGGNTKKITILLKYGATSLLPNNKKDNLFTYASRYSKSNTELLKMYEENISKFVENRGTPEDIIQMKTMLENGIFAHVNIKDSKLHNSTALLYQTKNGTIEGMKFLLERGANPNIRYYDMHNPTALFLAISNEEPKKIQLLLDYKADISIKNSSWLNVLEFCNKYSRYEFYEMIRRHIKKIEDICLLKKINVRKKFILNPDVLRIICDFI